MGTHVETDLLRGSRGLVSALVVAIAVSGCGSAAPAGTDATTVRHSHGGARGCGMDADHRHGCLRDRYATSTQRRFLGSRWPRGRRDLRLVGRRRSGWPVRSTAGVWASPDGRAWQRDPDDPAFDGLSLDDVIAVPDGGMIAVGYGRDPDRAVIVAATTEPSVTSLKVLDRMVESLGRDRLRGWFRRASEERSHGRRLTWPRVALAAVPHGPSGRSCRPLLDYITSVASSHRGLIVAEVGLSTRFWLSRDGQTWSEGGVLPGTGLFGGPHTRSSTTVTLLRGWVGVGFWR